MEDKPKASSTPKYVDVKGRRRIGETNENLIQSPIDRLNEKTITEGNGGELINQDSGSEHIQSDSAVDSGQETDKDTTDKSTVKFNTIFGNCLGTVPLSILGIAVAVCVCLYFVDGDIGNKSPKGLTSISQKYPSQVEDFWMSVGVVIEDIKKYNRPKSLILLYREEGTETVHKLVYEISKYAVCELTFCSSIPVQLKGDELNATEDYGKIIAANKEKILESGVMIVKNLEKCPGISAQAFHSLCDEYYPVVEKALFIFTVNVNDFHDNVKNLEKLLRKQWYDLKDDIFYPLFTRISGNVLPVMKEQ